MVPVLCIMPQCDGNTISHTVGKLLFDQEQVDIRLMTITRPKEYYDFSNMVTKTFPIERVNKVYRPERKGITTVRNLLAANLKDRDEEFVLHMDSDVWLSSSHDVIDLVNALNDKKEYVALALYTKRETRIRKFTELDHISLACIMFRSEFLKRYRFHNGADDTKCNCMTMCMDIRATGNKIAYLDSRFLKEE